MSRLLVIASTLALIFIASGLMAQPAIITDDPRVEFGCQFHATDHFDQPLQSTEPTSTSSYLGLITQTSQLEGQLIQLDSTNDLWTDEQTAVLIELAQVKQSIGDTRQARELYEQALYNMRINEGVYTLQQLPIILDLMTWYMAEHDEFTDQLGDRALFLYEKAYSADEQIMELVAGYRKLLELRLGAHYSHKRRYSIHVEKLLELQEKIDLQIERLVTSVDPAVRDRVLRTPSFYTAYDDLGRAVSSQEGGMDQVSGSTGLILEEVQGLLRPSEPDVQADYVRAKLLLDELQQSFEELEHVDRAALLNFYADYFLAQGDIAETINSYERILTIRVLRPDYQLRSLRALGQLYENEERWSEAIDSYNCWRKLSTKEDARVFIGLANIYQKLDEPELAIHHIIKYIETLETDGKTADENTYLVLKELYYETDDLAAGAEVTREMTALFK